MSDLKTQLSTYFDAVVERVDTDEPSSTSAVELRPQWNRSGWMYAVAAAAVVILLGAISFWALPHDPTLTNNPADTADTKDPPPGVSALPPVTLGVEHVWPETPSSLSSVQLAELFAQEALGWDSAGATEFSDAVPDGPAWLHIRQPGVDELVDVLTLPSTEGGRVIVEVGTPWKRGVDLRVLDGGGVSITLLRIVEADSGQVVLRLADGTQEARSTAIDLSTTAPIRVEFPNVSPETIGSILVRYVNGDGTVVAASGATPGLNSTSTGGPLDESLMSDATLMAFAEIDSALPDGLRNRPDDDWYSIPAGDFRAIVLIRAGESPHVYATSCDVLNSVDLPDGWEGTCLEMTVDGVRVKGTFGYDTTLENNTYADEQGFLWYATDCPNADVLLSAESADGLPNIETTSRDHVEAIAQTSPEYQVIPRNGWVWQRSDDGGFRVLQVEDFMLERTIENADQCPPIPAHATEGVPVAYRIEDR